MKYIVIVIVVLIALVIAITMMGGGSEETTNQGTANVGQLEEKMNNKMNTKDIVDTAVGAGDFTTLATALTEAGLIETLKGEGPFTVFAPNDAAFANLPEGTLESLLNDKDRLTQILTYHVVPGKVLASDVVNISEATTVQGGSIDISTEGGVKVNDANVIATDIEASNGVIHVIDKVLLPSN